MRVNVHGPDAPALHHDRTPRPASSPPCLGAVCQPAADEHDAGGAGDVLQKLPAVRHVILDLSSAWDVGQFGRCRDSQPPTRFAVHEDIRERGSAFDSLAPRHSHLRPLNAAHDGDAVELLDGQRLKLQLLDLKRTGLDGGDERLFPLTCPRSSICAKSGSSTSSSALRLRVRMASMISWLSRTSSPAPSEPTMPPVRPKFTPWKAFAHAAFSRRCAGAPKGVEFLFRKYDDHDSP